MFWLGYQHPPLGGKFGIIEMKCPKCHFENPSGTRFCSNCASPLLQEKDIGPTETIQVPITELAAGTIFARRYQIIEDLGKGGMGRVYKVLDTEVREKMALKLLNPAIAGDERTIERFRNELKLARTISHRNVCRMYDLGREEGTYYITMEYISGEDLKSLIHRIGALPVGKAVSIARQVGEGLAEAHRLGVVHRDLKPQNVMIDRDGNARIMDFGIARSLEAKGITGAGVMIGTPEYMSPEQVDGKDADQRSDIYSLGIVLFEMLTGRLPFEGDTPLSVAVKQKSETPANPKTINAQIPDELGRIILKCLEKPKEKRYQSADEFLAALARIEKDLPTSAQPLPLRKPLTSKQITVQFSLKKAVWPIAAFIAVVIIGFVVWKMIPHRAGPKHAIAVIGFTNRTGDQNLDYLKEAIPNLLITSLEQSGHFQVTSWERLKDLLRQAGRDATAVSDEEAGFEACRKAGIDALVLGSYIKAGETFATDVKILDVANKQILKTASAKGDGVSSVLKTQIDEISRTISRGLGPLAAKIEISQPKISELTTTSMEAYNYFLRGRDDYEKFYNADAQKFLKKAVELDPTFAVAYLYLGKVAGELYDTKAEIEAYEMAKKYSAKATEKEGLYIEAMYASVVERDSEKRLRLLQELVKKYPQEKQFHYDLGFIYDGRRRYPEAIEEYEKALALDPNFGFVINQAGYVYAEIGDFEKAVQYFERYAAINPGQANPIDSIAELYFRMGRFDEAKAKYQEALEIRPDFTGSCRGLAYIFAFQENYAEARHWLNEFIARAPTPSEKMEGYWLMAYFDYFLGRWDESLAGFLGIKEHAEKAGSSLVAAATDWMMGYIYADRGEYDLARTAFQRYNDWGTQWSPSLRTYRLAERSFFIGWVDFKEGILDEVGARLKEIEALLPKVETSAQEDMTLLFRLLETDVLLGKNLPEKAIEAGEEIVWASFPNMTTGRMTDYNIPFLKDVLARAYWKKGDLDKAIAEYTRLTTIDLKSQVRYLVHPLYHYRLGRVYEEKGEKVKAASQYQKFLEYWKDADPTHPELTDAQKRLANLKPQIKK
jgi:serine/threonine protein kinase/Tfp pilus assembly protein PilF